MEQVEARGTAYIKVISLGGIGSSLTATCLANHRRD